MSISIKNHTGNLLPNFKRPKSLLDRLAGESCGPVVVQSNAIASMKGVTGLLGWFFLNLLIVFFPMVAPSSNDLSSSIRYLMLSVVLCTTFSWWRLGSKITMPVSVKFVALTQIWLTICSVLGAIELGRTNDFEVSNYFLIMVMMFFFQAAVFSYIWPQLRRIILNIALGLFAVSAFIGFLQFCRFGPAVRIVEFYNTFATIEGWGGQRGIRAVGLTGWPEWMAFQCIVGWAVIGSRLMFRQLKKWEFSLACFFLLVGYMSQSRIMYVSLAICTVVFLTLLIKRDRVSGTRYLAAFFVLVSCILIFAQDNLAYALDTNLQTDTTLKYRQEVGWTQAWKIYEDRPWVGIGPDNDFVWEVRGAQIDKYVLGEYLDNGYLVMLAWGGLIGVALFVPIFIFAAVGAYKVLSNRALHADRRSVAFVLFVGVMGLLNNMFLNTGFSNIWVNCLLAALGGLCTSNSVESMEEMKAKLNIKRPKPLVALEPLSGQIVE